MVVRFGNVSILYLFLIETKKNIHLCGLKDFHVTVL